MLYLMRMKSFFVFLASLLFLLGSSTRPMRAFAVLDHVLTSHTNIILKVSHHHHGHQHHSHKKSNSKKSKNNHSHEMDLSLTSVASIIERKEVITFTGSSEYYDSTPFFESSLKRQTFPFKIFRPPIS